MKLPSQACRHLGRTFSTGALVVACGMMLAGCGENPNAPKQSSSGGGGSNEYAFGTKISFSKGGNATAMKVSGWSEPEPQFTWTEGNNAVLALRIPPADGAVALKVRASAFIKGPELPSQPVEVYVNDRKIADWQVSQLSEQTAALPQDLAKAGGLLTLSFRLPKATSPKEAGVSADPRVLGLCVYEIALQKVG